MHKIFVLHQVYFMPQHVTSTCARNMLRHEINLLYRCDDTGGCVMQFLPPDDEHMCS